MHVLVTADTLGGVWTYVRELVTGLVKRGVEVTLVSFGEIPSFPQIQWMDGLDGLDFRPTAFHLEWMQDAEQDLELSTEYLASVIREVQPDIVHLNQYAYGEIPCKAPKLVVAHSDVVSWWVAVHGHEPRENQWMKWYRSTVARGISGANALVAPSQWMLDAVCSYYGTPAQSRVVNNGRTPALFNPHMSKDDYVLSVGRLWDSGKQVSLLTQFESAMPVCLVGTERHPESHQAQNSGGSRKQIHCKGPLSELQLCQLYGRAAVYAATSRYEPFGLAPLEAALSRCTIVANDIPTFHELWGESAYYFRCNDAGSLSEAIRRMATDRELRIQYGNLAYQRARERFTAARMVDEYLELYRSLIGAEVKAA